MDPLALLLVPLVGLMMLNLPFADNLRRWTYWYALAWAVIQTGLVLFRADALITEPGGHSIYGFELHVDELTLVLLLSIGIVMFATLLAGYRAFADERKRSNFANLLLISFIGMNGTVLLRDMFSLYVFLEITSIASFILIAFNRDRDGLEGSFKYIILSAVATVLLLTAIALMLMTVGDTSFDRVHAKLAASAGSDLAKVAVAIFVCGLLIKGGLVPFHFWVPDAYSAAPSSVSVLLAGIATKAGGVYALIRVVRDVFPPSASLGAVLLLVGAVSIVIGAVAAISQSNMKRLFAYSSISQVGYIVLALGCGTPLAIVGAVFHLFNHSVFKSLLFMNAAAVEQRLGTSDMNKLGGLGGRMPVTSSTSVIAALSTAGVPPLSGFWSKLIIVVALWQAHHQAYAVIAVLLSVVTLAYLLAMNRKVFFGKTPQALAETQEASPGLVFASVMLAAITIGVGLVCPLLFRSFLLPISGLL